MYILFFCAAKGTQRTLCYVLLREIVMHSLLILFCYMGKSYTICSAVLQGRFTSLFPHDIVFHATHISIFFLSREPEKSGPEPVADKIIPHTIGLTYVHLRLYYVFFFALLKGKLLVAWFYLSLSFNQFADCVSFQFLNFFVCRTIWYKS